MNCGYLLSKPLSVAEAKLRHIRMKIRCQHQTGQLSKAPKPVWPIFK